jgi:hypothetical protein
MNWSNSQSLESSNHRIIETGRRPLPLKGGAVEKERRFFRKKMVLSGFHEGALAASGAAPGISPEKKIHVQHTTASSKPQKSLVSKRQYSTD